MNEKEAREYLAHASKKGMVMGLSVMEELMCRLGNPEKMLRIVHIAGTNGKGSILSYIEQIFLTSGYHTGRYVSPALGAYENRFLLDGKGIDPEKIPSLVEQVKQAVEEMERDTGYSPTIFEIETAMAFLCFREAEVSVVLLETGMGGRLDATNVIEQPLVSVIASVSLDHMQFLGDTLPKIAAEKAGIIKEGCPVVCYPDNPEEVKDVIREVCSQRHALYLEPEEKISILQEGPDGSRFSYGRYDKLEIFLPGRHQIYNAVTALQVVEQLRDVYEISDAQAVEGLKKTRWSGRLEKIGSHPSVYLDGAHNRDAASKLAAFLEQHFKGQRILAVTGVLADKEYEEMMRIVLPLVSKTAVITPDNARGLESSLLLETARRYCADSTDLGTIQAGMEWAKAEAKEEDVVIVFGSLSFLDQIGGRDE